MNYMANMSGATLDALKDSIATWYERATGEHSMPGVGSCALCRRFNNSLERPEYKLCYGCPVYEATGKRFCSGTPYTQYLKGYEVRAYGFSRPIKESTLNKRGQAEFEFLVSLLPRGENWTAPDGWIWYSKYED